jgi:hypothetical protein
MPSPRPSKPAAPHELWFSTLAIIELIEAASRTGRMERAGKALDVLSESTRASGSSWALGVEARSRALLTEGEAAEAHYRESIYQLEPTRLGLHLARSHLLYGEWLRRQRRRVDARNELRVAHDLFSDFGTEAFAERARVELQATGEHAQKRTVDTRGHSPRKRLRSRAVRRKDTPTGRSRLSCSSARARSSTTYARCSASSR